MTLQDVFRDSLAEIIESYAPRSKRTELCWYPSAGDNYRHIGYCELERIERESSAPPLVYFHANMWLPAREKGDPRVYVPSGEPAPGLEVIEATELSVIPNVTDITDDVWHLGTNDDVCKAFVMKLAVHLQPGGGDFVIHVSVVYVVTENSVFLVDVLLAHGLHVHTLVHIRDGGASNGGSRCSYVFHLPSRTIP